MVAVCGVVGRPASLRGCSAWGLRSGRWSAWWSGCGGGRWPADMGEQAAPWCLPGPVAGQVEVIRRADEAIRAAMLMSLRRIVGVVALARLLPVRVAAARVRLNAITAQTSQAAFAANAPDGRCASAEFFRSALTCSMIA